MTGSSYTAATDDDISLIVTPRLQREVQFMHRQVCYQDLLYYYLLPLPLPLPRPLPRPPGGRRPRPLAAV